MRVHELAKALNVTSKDLLLKLKTLKIAATSHSSALKDADVAKVRVAMGKQAVVKSPAVKPAAAKPKKAVVKTRAAAKPAKPARRAIPDAKSSTSNAAATLAAPKPKAAPAKQAPHTTAPAPVEATAQPAAPAPVVAAKQLRLRFPITVKSLADEMGVKASDVIKYLMQQRIFASMTHQLNEATVAKVAAVFNCEILPQPTIEDLLSKEVEPDPLRFVPRAPVVTFMGHVDHGKTSLLDTIRSAKVAEREAGGITQHIGAYEVQLDKGHVTFLDTPGHEAFSALRARGANVTDVVVVVIAADDGIMPQTVEAFDHAKAASVPIVIAINKIDKPDANPEQVKKQLTQYELVPEEWGGKTIVVPVSAKTREGIDSLLEMLLLEAELLELKADPDAPAQGTVIEASLTKERGPVATLLIQHGTLRVGESVLVGAQAGRVRALIDDRGRRVKEAGPTKPVEILGLPAAPLAGDRFVVMADEKRARQMAERRREQQQDRVLAHPKHISLEELHERIAAGKLKELKLIIKADVQGSLEAVVQNLKKLDVEKTEVQFKILHTGLGDISESDVILAAASEAIVIGFHVGINLQVQVLAAGEGVDIRFYQVIYELTHAIKIAIEGLLEPKLEEIFGGRAEVRKLFHISKVGTIAGCMVTKGTVRRDSTIRVIRGRDRIYQGQISSLKRVKDDVREIQEGSECGIALQGTTDLQPGDLLEAWEIKKVPRKLS